MSVRIGDLEFDSVSYDERADVLYLGVGTPQQATKTYGTPQGHAVDFDETGNVIGVTIVNAKWLSDRDGKITITVPSLIEASAEELAPALTPAGA